MTPASDAVAGRWPSPRALPGLGPSPVRALEDFPGPPSARETDLAVSTPVPLASSSKRPHTRSEPLATGARSEDPARSGPLLSWDSSTSRPFVAPPVARPLPRARGPGSGRRSQAPASRSVLVVSHHLDGFLRAEVAGLLRPARDHGVRRVSHRRSPTRRPVDRWMLPATGFTPCEGFPSPAAAPRHRDRSRSPRPLPSCRWRCRRGSWRLPRHPLPGASASATPPNRSTPGPCSADESVAPHRRFQRLRRSFLPWALFPYEVRRAPLPPDRGREASPLAGQARRPGSLERPRHGES